MLPQWLADFMNNRKRHPGKEIITTLNNTNKSPVKNVFFLFIINLVEIWNKNSS